MQFSNRSDALSGHYITRRNCLRYLIGGWGLMMTQPLSLIQASEFKSNPSILDRYLGEEIRYKIAYWLIGHVGDAKTEFFRTDLPGIYRISLEGHGIGFINSLLGGIVYSYTSFCQYLPARDCLRPVYFTLKKQRGSKVSLRSVRYNYKAAEISFTQANPTGDTRKQKEPMRADGIYEDYLTMLYNFRHGYYGPLQKGYQYSLPLYTREQMKPVALYIADLETEKRLRSREFNREGKDFFVRFQIPPEDVSSDSGEILGWFSADGVPVKGTIQDVVFFGDLWGELQGREIITNRQSVQVPDVVKTLLNGMLE